MPKRSPHPCNHPGCNQLTTGRFCQAHAVQHIWNHDGRTAAQRGYGYRWQKLREQALRRDCYLCVECLRHDRIAEATDVDHIQPKTRGGKDELSNLQSLCKECHTRKTQAEQGRNQGSLSPHDTVTHIKQ